MSARIASLPMYDADREAVEAWWDAVANALRRRGCAEVPVALDWPADLEALWRDPRLLLGQMCGLPLVTRFLDRVQVVGAFRYTAPGCDGTGYRSELVARLGDGDAILDFRGRVAAINSPDSHSGSNALRGLVAPLAVDGTFFGEWQVTGSHRNSLRAVQGGHADIAAIDCVSLAAICRRAPEAMAGLHVVASTAVAPGLPLVTAAGTSARELTALRQALSAACSDPSLARLRERLFIGGFEVVPASAWRVIEEVRQAAARALWAETAPRVS